MSVYIIRKREIGDVLWIEPVISELALKYKRVKVFTKYPALFENYPYKNVVFKQKLNIIEKIIYKIEKFLNVKWKTINLNGAYEKIPEAHFLHAYQIKAGLQVSNKIPSVYLSEEEKRYSEIPSKYIVIHIEENENKLNIRRIYGIDWNKVVSYLNSFGYLVVEVGLNKSNIENTIFKKGSLRELICIINKASYFIGIDSGPAHLAYAMQKPSVFLFSGVNPHCRFFSENLNGVILQQPCPTSGCYHRIKKPEHSYCSQVKEGEIPLCGNFTNEQVIAAFNKLKEAH